MIVELRRSAAGGADAATAAAAAGVRTDTEWRLPVELDREGFIEEATPRSVSDTARLVLEVVPGERRLLPKFGCGFHFLATIATAGERQLAAALAEEALERWAPGLHVRRVDVLDCDADRITLRLEAQEAVHVFSVSRRRPPGLAREAAAR